MKRFIFFCFLLFTFFAYLQAETIKIASGNSEGIYFKLGKALEKIIEKEFDQYDVIVLETSGSSENGELLLENKADIAFMQNDIVYNIYQEKRGFSDSTACLRGIASLYTEVIQIIGKKDLFIEELSDFINEPISVGEAGSRTEQNAIDILRVSNIKDRDIIRKNLSFSQIPGAIEKGEISGAFITAGLKLKLLENLADQVYFIPLPKETLNKLIDEYPYFIITNIPAKTYSGQNEPVSTVGVRALLTCRRDLNPEIVEMLCSALYSNLNILKEAHSIASKINLQSATYGMTLPLHEGAEKFLRRKTIAFFVVILIILVLLIAIYLKFKTYFKKLNKTFQKHLRQNIHFRIGFVVALMFIVGTIGTYYFERRVNEEFDTIFKAFWATIVYLLSGFDITPITTGGKISALMLLIGGMGILGTVVGNIASIFMKEGVEKMPNNLKQHIVICNWNKRGETVIEELHHPSAEPDTGINVLADIEINEGELRDKSKRYSNVYFIKGKPTSYERLKLARVHFAKSIIVLSDSGDSEPDPKAILTCLAIKQLCKDMKVEKKPHIIAELMDRANRQIALDAGADEIVSAGFYRTGIMLQSARYHNLSDIFHELLIYEDNTSSIFILQSDTIPKAIQGKTFPQASEIFNSNRDEKNPVILIGVRRTTKEGKSHVILNPLPDGKSHNGEFDVFRNGDALVVIAQAYPDLSYLKE
ncbi:MAG: TAXI family TRAP transporter solute-binding subunit [Candidatus Cloacimonadales bacterium]|nr:TAXI family TRAP transporter solute-binding subunit [Candidatus Cloacimonadales bacterium]